VESKKTDTNELIYKTGIDSWTYKTNSWSPKGRAWRHKLGVWDEEIRDTICRINSKVLLDSTGNSTQNVVINDTGKEYMYISMNN